MADPSFTINEWCGLRKVSRPMYYKLKSQGLAPRTHSVGDKQLIGPDADRECLAAREAEAAAERVAKRDGTSGKAA